MPPPLPRLPLPCTVLLFILCLLLCGRLCRVTSKERKQEIEQAVAAQLDMQRTSVISDSINGEETQSNADAQSGATKHKEEPAW